MYSSSRGALEQNRPWWTDTYKSENSTLRLQLCRAAGTPCCLLRGCLQQARAEWLGILVNDPREIKAKVSASLSREWIAHAGSAAGLQLRSVCSCA